MPSPSTVEKDTFCKATLLWYILHAFSVGRQSVVILRAVCGFQTGGFCTVLVSISMYQKLAVSRSVGHDGCFQPGSLSKLLCPNPKALDFMFSRTHDTGLSASLNRRENVPLGFMTQRRNLSQHLVPARVEQIAARRKASLRHDEHNTQSGLSKSYALRTAVAHIHSTSKTLPQMPLLNEGDLQNARAVRVGSV